LCDLSAFVVATQNCDSILVADLFKKEKFKS
jgi:hypothetical protein